jgi:LPS-assembly protein
MSVRKKVKWISLGAFFSLVPVIAISAVDGTTTPTFTPLKSSLAADTLARQLGWIQAPSARCGGYYLEEPFAFPVGVEKVNSIETTGQQGLFSLRGTSVIEGKVTINRAGQQITTNKAYLYRDASGKINAVEMIGNVHLREPNTLIVAKEGRYDFVTNEKVMRKILYRTSLNSVKDTTGKSTLSIAGPKVAERETLHERKITKMTAWGKAYEFKQTEPKIFKFARASFTTCPPISPMWRLRASHIVLDKNTGRGYATNARILVKQVPVFYTPYINFSIDNQRKTGFLWPVLGAPNKWGPTILTPFYWNMAPNYDSTITPGYLSKRGVQISDNFRYLTPYNTGNLDVSILPGDRDFRDFQTSAKEEYSNSSDPAVQAELSRLLNTSNTRRALAWRDQGRFSDHWHSKVDFNYAGDDYYMQDFGNTLNEITQNQLLEQAELEYKSTHTDFIGRLQAYQTLHPISENEPPIQNQYRRLPQLMLNLDYPEQKYGLEYFANNEATHFDINKTPGSSTLLPVGNRINVQPGISLPLTWPYFYINPRLQLALTHYDLQQTAQTNTPDSIQRSLPIFDIASGFALNRDLNLFGYLFHQTLEPQVYYTYIPYRNQASIPLFDTTINTLTYDQIFNYNRFTGIDRIGDANQIGVGVTTRLIDQETGLEKVRIGVGEIIYFANRLVTQCNDDSCSDNPSNHSNYQRLSPVSGIIDYHIQERWHFTTNAIWNPVSKQIDNSTLTLQYTQDPQRVMNFGFTFARSGDVLSGIVTNSPRNNLKVTDISFAWPFLHDVSAVGRWSYNWNHQHLQNLLYGLQYESCCWAVQFVGGRAFTGLDPSNNQSFNYNNEFYIQFALKGLGNVGKDPSALLGNITGYQSQFGQVI